MADSKTCFKCGVNKPLDDFYAHPHMGDKHLGKCKECTKKDVAEHRARNLCAIRKYDSIRKNLPHRKELKARVTGEWRRDHPEGNKAHSIVFKAIKSGELAKQPCWVCGSENVHAHHPDYSRPLDVIWLCPEHHKQAHHNT